jgi:hypothetical protein
MVTPLTVTPQKNSHYFFLLELSKIEKYTIHYIWYSSQDIHIKYSQGEIIFLLSWKYFPVFLWCYCQWCYHKECVTPQTFSINIYILCQSHIFFGCILVYISLLVLSSAHVMKLEISKGRNLFCFKYDKTDNYSQGEIIFLLSWKYFPVFLWCYCQWCYHKECVTPQTFSIKIVNKHIIP